MEDTQAATERAADMNRLVLKSRDELRRLCSAAQVPGYRSMTKDQMFTALVARFQPTAKPATAATDTTAATPVNRPSAIRTPVTDPATSRIYSRTEVLLGPINGIALDETRKRGRTTRTAYELNVIDGWVRVHEWMDDAGIRWIGESRTRSHVGAVLDAVPKQAEFIARVHLAWIGILRRADRRRQATRQRRALDVALLRHGLAVKPVIDATAPRRGKASRADQTR
jgi:hypothetical protein